VARFTSRLGPSLALPGPRSLALPGPLPPEQPTQDGDDDTDQNARDDREVERKVSFLEGDITRKLADPTE